MADKLINKQLVDIDELLQFLSDNGFDIDDGVWNKHEMSLRELFDEYKKNTIPDVEIGQTVWVISRDYHDIYSIKECHVHKKQIRARYTFSVRGRHCYCGTFTKNSIGKTVFFSKEAAIESVNGKEYNSGRVDLNLAFLVSERRNYVSELL